jgi:hypothetical protein
VDEIRNLEYEYDLMDNVTQRQNHISGLSEGFTYDALDRFSELLWFVEGCPSNGFIAIFGHAAIGIIGVGSVLVLGMGF